jgi:hypothetical protein
LIPKVIPSDSRRGTFATLVYYIARDKKEHAQERAMFGAPEMGAQNLDVDLESDLDTAIELLDMYAAMARRSKQDPVNHLVLSWQAGEHPTREQVEQAVTHVLKAVGMAEAEAIWAIHRDTDCDHVHIALNRIHPRRGTWLKMPQGSYAVMHKACREIELEQGWLHSRGTFVVKDGQIAKREPYPPGTVPGPSDRARRAEKNIGAPTFQAWVAHEPAATARAVLQRPGADWQDLHRALAPYGVRIQPGAQRGLVVVTEIGARTLAGKASLLGLGNLQKVLGLYYPPVPWQALQADPAKTYARFLDGVQRGDIVWEPGEMPAADANGKEPVVARSAARRALHARFLAQHGPVAKADKAQALATLRERQAGERLEQRQASRSECAAFLVEARSQGMPLTMARSIWAAGAARERDALRARHAAQKQQFRARYGHAAAWREWLAQQAMLGDEEAGRALRGLRYRETRAGTRERNGIEGDESLPFKAGSLAALRADVDVRRQIIAYRDASGRACFTDHGPRIEVHDEAPGAATVEAAIVLAAEKYGGQISIQGSSAFRELATRTAVRLGVRVRNPDLQDLVREARRPRRLLTRDEGLER